jgi:sRNA-binding protein
MSSTPSSPSDTPDPSLTAPEAAAAPAGDATPVPTPAATGAKLAELFPGLFKGQPKPLKLRIQVDIQERAPGVFSKQALAAFFRRYTGATSYLIAVSRGQQRFDLDGQPAGELTDEHRQVALDELTRRRAKNNERREQEEGERRQRASLLRDFETTKLTEANFCALKGIAPEALPELLALAREEAKAMPPREEGRRDGRGPAREGRGDGRGAPRGDHRGGDRRPDGRGPSAGPRGPRPDQRGGGRGPGGSRPDARGPGRGPQGQGPRGDRRPAAPAQAAAKPADGAPAPQGDEPKAE